MLKNITLAGNSIFTGMKIDFHACVFRFGPMSLFINLTIRSVFSLSLLRVLTHLQLELGNHCEEMVEDIRLDTLVFFPYFIAGEKIDLDRYAIFSRLQLADDQIEVRINNREACQVFLHIDTEHLRIGRYHAFVRLVVGKQRNLFAERVEHIRRTELDGIEVEKDGFHHATATRFDHSPPVLERSVYQRIRRDGGNGIIEILYLDCIQRDLLYDTVRVRAGNRDPVARS